VRGSFANKECKLIDVSREGAKMVLDWDTDLPTRFLLNRVPNGAAKTICDVVWRRGQIFGIKFVRPSD
jgi:hypothetical protein